MCCLSNELTDVYSNKNNEQDTTLFHVSLRKRATLLAQLSPLNMQTICPDFSQLREAGQPEPFPGQPEIGSGWPRTSVYIDAIYTDVLGLAHAWLRAC